MDEKLKRMIVDAADPSEISLSRRADLFLVRQKGERRSATSGLSGSMKEKTTSINKLGSNGKIQFTEKLLVQAISSRKMVCHHQKTEWQRHPTHYLVIAHKGA
jgi:hypothetical protein